jgi:hypothetical protein
MGFDRKIAQLTASGANLYCVDDTGGGWWLDESGTWKPLPKLPSFMDTANEAYAIETARIIRARGQGG